MNGRSSPSSFITASAASPLKCGSDQSEMIASHGAARSAARIASASSTRSV